MISERVTISLDEFGRYFLKKWKIAVLLVSLCVGVFCVATKLLGEEISVPHSEEYLYFEQESRGLERYLDESVLMKMNPTEIPQITLYVEQYTDEVALKDYVVSKEIWDEFASERNKNYFHELLTWQESGENIEIIIRHVTEEECQDMANYLQQKIKIFDSKAQISVGNIRFVKDEELQAEQLRWYDRIEYSKTLLLEAEAGYTVTINIFAAAVTGILVGCMLTVVLVLCLYLIDRKKLFEK